MRNLSVRLKEREVVLLRSLLDRGVRDLEALLNAYAPTHGCKIPSPQYKKIARELVRAAELEQKMRNLLGP